MSQKNGFLFVCFVYLIFLFVCLFVLLMGLLAVDAATTLNLFLAKIFYFRHLNLTLNFWTTVLKLLAIDKTYPISNSLFTVPFFP